jgi:hypothetical protein
MKFKILSSLSLFAVLAIMFTTLSSNDNGNTTSSGTTCGSCHGNSANSATSVSLTGLPTTFVANQVYNLTFTISNSSLTHGGFNIKCSAGSFTAGSGSKLKTGDATQITHSAVSTSNTWSFTWKAPTTTGAVTFNAVGNAVNNNGNDDSGDQWNTTTITVPGSFPTTVSNVETATLNCYPNPATTQINVVGASNVKVLNMFGQMMSVSTSKQADQTLVQLNSLTAGMYILVGEVNGRLVSSTIVKQ